jgi:PAS domain S-box-containing protein
MGLASVRDLPLDSPAVVREQLRLVIDVAPHPMLLADTRGHIVQLNAHVEQLFGYGADELLEHPVERLIPQSVRGAHGARRAAWLRRPAPGAMSPRTDIVGLHKNGSEVPIEVGLHPVRTSAGVWILASIVDMSARRRAEAALDFALAQRQVLLREAHHRVKNGLQIIVSMLSLQSMSSPDPQVQRSLSEVGNRIRAMALIHEKLSGMDHRGSVDFKDYVQSLCQHLLEAHSVEQGTVQMRFHIGAARLGPETTMSCGMILCELLTHILARDVGKTESTSVSISLRRSEAGRWRLAVNQPPPLRAPVSSAPTPLMTVQLIRTLAGQLDGVLHMDLSHGTVFRLQFSDQRYPTRF